MHPDGDRAPPVRSKQRRVIKHKLVVLQILPVLQGPRRWPPNVAVKRTSLGCIHGLEEFMRQQDGVQGFPTQLSRYLQPVDLGPTAFT